MKTFRLIYLAAVLIVLLLASLACDLPIEFAAQEEKPNATQTMQALATRVALELKDDDDADEGEPSGDGSPEPAATVTPSLGPPMVSVSVDTNCRFGPGDVYDYLGALLVGEEALITGKLADESFWYIENPDAPPPYCWVWAAYAQVEGDTSGVSVLTPPPTPTPTLFTVSGIAFADVNGNGVRDSGEVGLPDHMIDLRVGGFTGDLFAWMRTDSNGEFQFNDVPPGTYAVLAYSETRPAWCGGAFVENSTDPSYTFEAGPGLYFFFGFHCR